MKKDEIRDMHALDREINLRRARLKDIEKRLGANMEALPGQIPRMALYAFLGSRQKPASPDSFPAQLLSMAMDNEKLQAGLAALIDSLAQKLGIGLEKFTQSVFHRKKRAETEAP